MTDSPSHSATDSTATDPAVDDAGEANAAPATPPAEPVDPAVLDRRVEAVLMATERAVSATKVAEAVGADSTKAVHEAIERLNAFYDEHTRSFRIESVAGGYQILTMADYGENVAALNRSRGDNRLSPSAMETLAIIAYKQPIIRADVEAIRGVACGEVIRSLMERHLVKITGRAEEIGRPMLYGTTKTFLEIFGLASLKDLPKAEELHQP